MQDGPVDILLYHIHPYYTLKFIKIQAKLDITAIFVNYDDFYVNIVMSTEATELPADFIIFDYFDNILGIRIVSHTKY